MRVGVVGYGLIGRERVAALVELRAQGIELSRIMVVDPYLPRESRPELPTGVSWVDSLDALFEAGPDWIIVATPHDVAVSIAVRGLAIGAQVLLEKPLGRNLVEARQLIAAQPAAGRLFVGLNYRFFAGINALLADTRAGLFGPVINVSMILAHGGAPGMEAGWKLDPQRAGGGCLIDPGIHLFDLCRLLRPAPIELVGVAGWSGFWKTGIEEDAHVLLRSDGSTINLQISVVRWRSQCRIEVHGMDGYGVVTGRGRSYGPQRYVRGRRWGWQSARNQAESETLVLESPANDSFTMELRALFTGEPVQGISPASAADGLAAMELISCCAAVLTPPSGVR